jgi:hypothetical protein
MELKRDRKISIFLLCVNFCRVGIWTRKIRSRFFKTRYLHFSDFEKMRFERFFMFLIFKSRKWWKIYAKTIPYGVNAVGKSKLFIFSRIFRDIFHEKKIIQIYLPGFVFLTRFLKFVITEVITSYNLICLFIKFNKCLVPFGNKSSWIF